MYPKMLYLVGWEDVKQNVVVNTPDEEKAAKTKGYKEMEEFTKAKKTTKAKAKVVTDGTE